LPLSIIALLFAISTSTPQVLHRLPEPTGILTCARGIDVA
jgi:hypothetical protein